MFKVTGSTPIVHPPIPCTLGLGRWDASRTVSGFVVDEDPVASRWLRIKSTELNVWRRGWVDRGHFRGGFKRDFRMLGGIVWCDAREIERDPKVRRVVGTKENWGGATLVPQRWILRAIVRDKKSRGWSAEERTVVTNGTAFRRQRDRGN